MSASTQFLRGFAKAGGFITLDLAEREWAEFSHNLTATARTNIESEGFASGIKEGLRYGKLDLGQCQKLLTDFLDNRKVKVDQDTNEQG